MNTYPETTPEKSHQLNRRLLLKGLAAATGIAVALGSERDARVHASEESPATPEQEQPVSQSLGNAEKFYRIASEGTPDELLQAFQITKNEAATPDDFARELAERIQDWVTAGCTPTELSQFESPEEFQAYANETYGMVAATALGGDAAMEETNGDIASSELYKQITDLKNQVLARYKEMMLDGGTIHAGVTMEALHQEMTDQIAEKHLFRMTVDLRYSSDIDTDEPFIMEASLDLALHMSGPNYQLRLLGGQFLPVENAV